MILLKFGTIGTMSSSVSNNLAFGGCLLLPKKRAASGAAA
jgi:hypothetical protein